LRCRRGQFSALGDLMGDFQSATLIHVESKVVHGRVLVELKPDRRYSSRKKKKLLRVTPLFKAKSMDPGIKITAVLSDS
jgi:hypothetical protein